MATQAKVFSIDSLSGVFEFKNYGGYTYNVYLDGQEIDVFSYTGNPEHADIVCHDWAEHFEQERYGIVNY
jgi:hypothetical protein